MRGWCGDASSSMDTAHSHRTKSTAWEKAAVSQAAPVPGALEPSIRTYGIPVQPRGAREYPTTNTGVGIAAVHPQEPITAQCCCKRSAHLEVLQFSMPWTLHPLYSCSLAAVHASFLSLSILFPAPSHSLPCSCPTAGTGTGSQVYPGQVMLEHSIGWQHIKFQGENKQTESFATRLHWLSATFDLYILWEYGQLWLSKETGERLWMHCCPFFPFSCSVLRGVQTADSGPYRTLIKQRTFPNDLDFDVETGRL